MFAWNYCFPTDYRVRSIGFVQFLQVSFFFFLTDFPNLVLFLKAVRASNFSTAPDLLLSSIHRGRATQPRACCALNAETSRQAWFSLGLIRWLEDVGTPPARLPASRCLCATATTAPLCRNRNEAAGQGVLWPELTTRPRRRRRPRVPVLVNSTTTASSTSAVERSGGSPLCDLDVVDRRRLRSDAWIAARGRGTRQGGGDRNRAGLLATSTGAPQRHALSRLCRRRCNSTLPVSVVNVARGSIDMTSDHQAAIHVHRHSLLSPRSGSTAAGQRSPSVLDTRNWTPTTSILRRCIKLYFIRLIPARSWCKHTCMLFFLRFRDLGLDDWPIMGIRNLSDHAWLQLCERVSFQVPTRTFSVSWSSVQSTNQTNMHSVDHHWGNEAALLS